jgi:hypothetical protein
MLAPDDRRVLLETLRPPEGYVVDRTIATTYTLDLVALLMAPLAFSLYDRLATRDDDKQKPHLDSFGLLQAVRDHAGQTTVFCQAGAIHRPPRYRQLFPYLEGSVVEVRARAEEGIFHAKLFVQRFLRDDEPTRYRVIVPSRNLTFDSTWDTMLVLEGELRDRSRAIARNHPIADLVAALPDLAVRTPSQRVRDDVALVADELRRVDFELPDGIDELRFWPLGIEGKSAWPFGGRMDRALVVSPFLTATFLERFGAQGKPNVLISRAEELDTLPTGVLKAFPTVFTLHDAAIPEPDDGEPDPPPSLSEPPPTGLHAKLYVADDGWNAHMWTGSANATSAAFDGNVEILVQLSGKRSKIGVDATLEGEKGRTGLRALLAPYAPPSAPMAPNAAKLDLERRLRVLRSRIAALELSAMVERLGREATEVYAVTLRSRRDLVFPSGLDVQVRCWPIALSDTRAQTVHPQPAGVLASFSPCSFGALTAFFAFEVVAAVGEESCTETFVMHAPLEGAPADRQARVLQGLLDDPAKVLRFLRMLLATDAFEALSAFDDQGGPGERGRPGSSSGEIGHDVPLLEALMRAFDRDPQRLVGVERLIRELSSTPDGAALLPDELARVWGPIWSAHTEQLAARGQR